MQGLAVRLALQRVEFLGELHGREKQDMYQSADLFVLPTHSENFGLTVAEALAAGTPAIVSKGAPWHELVARGAGWWIDIGVEPLVACLEDALSRPSETLSAMGARGRAWMIEEYSWPDIGRKMAETYRWLIDKTTPVPDWVRLD
jgi:glycosyltransferase involved in cell wall biosynthesis